MLGMAKPGQWSGRLAIVRMASLRVAAYGPREAPARFNPNCLDHSDRAPERTPCSATNSGPIPRLR